MIIVPLSFVFQVFLCPSVRGGLTQIKATLYTEMYYNTTAYSLRPKIKNRLKPRVNFDRSSYSKEIHKYD